MTAAGDRDAAVRVLNEAFTEGRLTADEHSERVRAAYAARTWRELAGLAADPPRPSDATGLASGQPTPFEERNPGYAARQRSGRRPLAALASSAAGAGYGPGYRSAAS